MIDRISEKGYLMKHFYMKQKVFSFRDRYKIYDENQNVVFHCVGKVLSLSARMSFMDTSTDQELFLFRKKVLSFMPTYYIYDPFEKQIAVIKRRIAFMKAKLDIDSEYGQYRIEGNYFQLNFSIFEGEKEVANVQKKWISWGDSYEITIFEDEKYKYLTALVVVIDRIFHEQKSHNTISFGR